MNTLAKVQNTIDFIENNLFEISSVCEVVSVSGFSTPHFYRLFWNLTGNTVKEYIRLRKLSQAFVKIASSGRCDLIDVAFDCGFSSQEAFTRAFKKEFGFTPGFVRKKQINVVPFDRIILTDMCNQSESENDKNMLAKSIVSFEDGHIFSRVAKSRYEAIDAVISCLNTHNKSVQPPYIYTQRTARVGLFEAFGFVDCAFENELKMFFGGLYLSVKLKRPNLSEFALTNQLASWFSKSKMEMRNTKILTEVNPKTRKNQSYLVPIKNTTRRYIMTKPEEFANVYEIELPPFRVASYRAESATPEDDAMRVLFAWAKKKGLIDKPETRIFGFNNPNPTEGNPVYGYEFWVTVDDDVKGDEQIEIKEFDGGLYGAVDIIFGDMGENWGKLIKWRKFMGYEYGCHQWLEETKSFRDPPRDFRNTKMTLYTPIKK